MPFGYPVALELRHRRCVVIGGGEPARHKAEGLLDGGATTVVVVADGFTPALERLGEQGRVTLIRRRYRRGDLAGAFLAVAAAGDPDLHAEVAEEAAELCVLLNAVDDPAHCHFATPSVVRRGDLVIAVSTGGKAPALAKRLRRELAERYGPEFSALVDLLGEARTRARALQALPLEEWGRRWERALAEDLPALVRAGRADEARRLLHRHLVVAVSETSEARSMSAARGRHSVVPVAGAGAAIQA